MREIKCKQALRLKKWFANDFLRFFFEGGSNYMWITFLWELISTCHELYVSASMQEDRGVIFLCERCEDGDGIPKTPTGGMLEKASNDVLFKACLQRRHHKENRRAFNQSHIEAHQSKGDQLKCNLINCEHWMTLLVSVNSLGMGVIRKEGVQDGWVVQRLRVIAALVNGRDARDNWRQDEWTSISLYELDQLPREVHQGYRKEVRSSTRSLATSATDESNRARKLSINSSFVCEDPWDCEGDSGSTFFTDESNGSEWSVIVWGSTRFSEDRNRTGRALR